MRILTERVGTAKHLGIAGMGFRPDAELRVVATEGGIEDWAAYAGPANLGPTDIAQNGSKLFEDDAVRIFAVLNPKRYRR